MVSESENSPVFSVEINNQSHKLQTYLVSIVNLFEVLRIEHFFLELGLIHKVNRLFAKFTVLKAGNYTSIDTPIHNFLYLDSWSFAFAALRLFIFTHFFGTETQNWFFKILGKKLYVKF